ncbi:hypothetical protein KY346_04405 [Candidatus Woesearchaeota archaeon]|nr:hypothetical protein [Candidatus Woesearchaeota archaeon]
MKPYYVDKRNLAEVAAFLTLFSECYGDRKITPLIAESRQFADRAKAELACEIMKLESRVQQGDLTHIEALPELYVQVFDYSAEKACTEANDLYQKAKPAYLAKRKDHFQSFHGLFTGGIALARENAPAMHDMHSIFDELEELSSAVLSAVDEQDANKIYDAEFALLYTFEEFKGFINQLPESSFANYEKFYGNLSILHQATGLLKELLFPLYKTVTLE